LFRLSPTFFGLAGLCIAQKVFELGKDLFDRIEIDAVRACATLRRLRPNNSNRLVSLRLSRLAERLPLASAVSRRALQAIVKDAPFRAILAITRFLPMRWVRINRRWSTCLALAAMTLQLVLSFGHVHLEKLASNSAIASIVAAKPPSSQQSPAQHPANEAD
jgi:hypothetical protein